MSAQPFANAVRAITRQFFSFATIGVISTAVHYVTLIAGVALGFDPIAASAAGWTLGAVASYTLNYRLTFKSHLSHAQAAPRFALVTGIGLLLNTLLMAILIRVLGVQYLVAQIFATGAILCWNFTLSRAWAFKSKPAETARSEPAATVQPARSGVFAKLRAAPRRI